MAVRKTSTIAGRVTELERRLALLEGRRIKAPATSDSALGLLDSLAARRGARFVRGHNRGAVAYTGVAKMGEREYRWAREHGVPDLLDAEWANAASMLVCLGSPARLALLRLLLAGPCDRTALQAALGRGTSGQLYHHLRDLQAARLIAQRARGVYEISPAAVVPLLAILGAALDLGGTREAPPRKDGA
jgi:hypothetical protein